MLSDGACITSLTWSKMLVTSNPIPLERLNFGAFSSKAIIPMETNVKEPPFGKTSTISPPTSLYSPPAISKPILISSPGRE